MAPAIKYHAEHIESRTIAALSFLGFVSNFDTTLADLAERTYICLSL
jgi:hypothetical protein